MRWLWFALIAWIAFWWSSGAFAHHRYSAKWDFEFFMAQRKYAPPDLRDDWKWTKAQCIAESGLREDAMSPVGAQGLCQVMPNTWREVALPGSSPWSAKANIKAAVRYMRRMWNVWSGRPRTKLQQLRLSQASYNAGAGHIIRAQFKAGDPLTWSEIAPYLHLVTGRHSQETITYVKCIGVYHNQLTCRSSRC